ncbi:hypothetical protein NDN01_03195 [Sphingomonas sp. QA11]|uniref:hypothetical protein n=1 Tax=Sphingomonas sp. QA11 TaxID=2950605 RepID=UPI002349A86B|nr:hypothetical protein [Sphingomonas sp. QA11]WCM27951.1 hypothetical protein NDN01_03195 [Sphingomonas sp. QA11]
MVAPGERRTEIDLFRKNERRHITLDRLVLGSISDSDVSELTHGWRRSSTIYAPQTALGKICTIIRAGFSNSISSLHHIDNRMRRAKPGNDCAEAINCRRRACHHTAASAMFPGSFGRPVAVEIDAGSDQSLPAFRNNSHHCRGTMAAPSSQHVLFPDALDARACERACACRVPRVSSRIEVRSSMNGCPFLSSVHRHCSRPAHRGQIKSDQVPVSDAAAES